MTNPRIQKQRHLLSALVAMVWAAPTASAAAQQHPAEPRLATATEQSRRLGTRIELACQGPPRGLAITDLDQDGREDLLALIDEPGLCSIWRGLAPRLADLAKPTGLRLADYSLGPVVLDSGALAFADRGGLAWERVRVTFEEDGRALADRARHALTSAPRAMCTFSQPDSEGLLIATEQPAVELWLGSELDSRAELGDGLPTCMTQLADTGWIAVGCQSGPSLRLLDRNESGELAEFAALDLDGIPRAIHTHDLDRDGDLELIAVGGDRSAWVFGFEAAGGTATLADADLGDALLWKTGAIPIDLTSGDTNGDGVPELIAAHHLDQQLGVLSDFDRTGPREVVGLYGGPSPWSMATGDLDGDGRNDLAISNPGAAAVSVYFGDRSGLREPLNVPATPAPHSMDVGDLDGDGRPEIALLSAIDAEVCWLSQSKSASGSPGNWERIGALPVRAGADALQLMDIDRDGALDLAYLWTGPAGGGLVVQFGDGNAGFAAGERLELDIEGVPFDMQPADVDSDGALELVISEASGGRLLVVETDARAARIVSRQKVGEGTGALIAVRGPDGGFAGIAIARVDAEGRFGASLFAPAPNATWKELGVVTTPRPPEDFATGDFDGDGRHDLAILMQGRTDNAPGSILVALAPTGNERGFRLQAERPTGPKPFHLAAGDLDGDGCDELFASSQYANRVSAFRGVPSRTEALVPSYDLGAHRGCMNLAVVDADSDGDLDLLVGNNHSGDVSLILSY